MKRRDFLRHLGTLAAAPVIVPLLPAIAAETEAGVVYTVLRPALSGPIRGAEVRGIIIDEYATLPPGAWERVETIMGVTPNGNVWSFSPTETPILVGPKGEGIKKTEWIQVVEPTVVMPGPGIDDPTGAIARQLERRLKRLKREGT